jgi:hypothetical protein
MLGRNVRVAIENAVSYSTPTNVGTNKIFALEPWDK